MRQAKQIIRLVGNPPQCRAFAQLEAAQIREPKVRLRHRQRRHFKTHRHGRRSGLCPGDRHHRWRGRGFGLRLRNRLCRPRLPFPLASLCRQPLHGFPLPGQFFLPLLFLARQLAFIAVEIAQGFRREFLHHPAQRGKLETQRPGHVQQGIFNPGKDRPLRIKGRLHDALWFVAARLRFQPIDGNGITAGGQLLQPALQGGANGVAAMRGIPRLPPAIPVQFPSQLIRARAMNPAHGNRCGCQRRGPDKFRVLFHLIEGEAEIQQCRLQHRPQARQRRLPDRATGARFTQRCVFGHGHYQGILTANSGQKFATTRSPVVRLPSCQTNRLPIDPLLELACSCREK